MGPLLRLFGDKYLKEKRVEEYRESNALTGGHYILPKMPTDSAYTLLRQKINIWETDLKSSTDMKKQHGW